MKITSSSPVSSQNSITDVVDFFFDLTEKYEQFEQSIVAFTNMIPGFTPQQIFNECNKIWETRNKLAMLDQRMFEIIELAGNEIAQSPIVEDYRVAFEKANIACSHLYQELNEYKDGLQKLESHTISPHYQ